MKTFTLRMNSVASVLRRVLGGAFCAKTWSVAALGLILLLGPSGASADIVSNYVFAPGASTVLGGDTLAISGSFTFDFTTTIESQVAITLSGNPTYAGTYTATNLALGALAEVFADDGDLSLTILFANVLDLSPVELQTVDWQGSGPIPPQLQGQDLTGFVEFAPTPAVPEPNSVILLVTLVAMAGFLTRRKLAGGWVIQKNP